MPQLSLYVDDSTMETLRISARGEGVSMSRYASNLIRNRAQSGNWPQGYWENIYGCLYGESCFDDLDEGLNSKLDDDCS